MLNKEVLARVRVRPNQQVFKDVTNGARALGSLKHDKVPHPSRDVRHHEEYRTDRVHRDSLVVIRLLSDPAKDRGRVLSRDHELPSP